MKKNLVSRRSLDRRLAGLGKPRDFAVPPRGWIRAIRGALGMSATDLAARLGVRPQTVSTIESSETARTIQLGTLDRVAAALDCTVVYALIPRTSLEQTVIAQARQQVRARLARVHATMALEDQTVNQLDELIDDEALLLVDTRQLWAAQKSGETKESHD